MKEFIEKLLGRLIDENNKWIDTYNIQKCKGEIDRYADGMSDGFEQAIEIVNQLAEESAKVHVVNDLAVIESLPSLYPLQAFEEEAIHRVVGNANNNGWIACSEKKPYEITLEGCDDYTCFGMELTEQEYQFLLRVSEKANETSTYVCMPTMSIVETQEHQPKGE